jgi:hypothetical protein
MPYITDHKQKFDDLMFCLKNKDQIRLPSNGGNSILFSYEPKDELQYINKAIELFGSTAVFIDVSQLLVDMIEQEGWESFKQYYQDFIKTPHVIFKSDDPSLDLFDMIINEIKLACDRGKIPILIRTGCLYGTGIDNVNIMEHNSVMTLPSPLVIFYPSSVDEEGNLKFLNFKPASKYRCKLVK